MTLKYSPLYEKMRKEKFTIRPEIFVTLVEDPELMNLQDNEFVLSLEGQYKSRSLYVNCKNSMEDDGYSWWTIWDTPIVIPDEVLAQAVILGWGQEELKEYKEKLKKVEERTKKSE